jgi:hypothetical protein
MVRAVRPGRYDVCDTPMSLRNLFGATPLFVCVLAGCGGDLVHSDGTSASTETGGRPVVDGVDPSTGPNSGGTSVRVSGSGFAQDGGTSFTFAGSPAFNVTCSSDTECSMTTPPAGFTPNMQLVDVRATVGALPDLSGKRTSATNGNDVFTYAAGPNCSTVQDCSTLAAPELIVTCPTQVTFFELAASNPMLATGTTYSAAMNCGALAACFGSPTNGSCSPYSLNPPADACGDLNFCNKCSAAGGYCSSGPDPLCCYGSSLCTPPPAPCHP